ncbi:histidine--tRNA ligase [Candidatus Uhrbacteria bacterium]|nr:histidine--tRNA ligase [Candidatus Uhrbacteria bacterium]
MTDKQDNKKKQPEVPALPKATKESPRLLRGMKDVLPQDGPWWNWIEDTARRLSAEAGCDRLDPPHLEDMRLFVRAVGKETDIVEKELFSFVDQGGETVALRPEFTAGMARAYIEHGFVNLPQPVRLFTMGSLFRYERPQAGRFREHHQWGVEMIGDQHPILDAECIMLAMRFFEALGVSATVELNSLGCATCRPPFREALVAFYRTRKKHLCENCQRRLAKNPLRLLDCKEPTCQPFKEGAPNIVDMLCDVCKNHFIKVLEYCDAGGVPYVLATHLVRGLDYYTKTVFEFYTTRTTGEGETRIALGGGGRYDDLLVLLGGRPTPAVGFGVGIERIVGELKIRGLNPPMLFPPEVFVAQLGDQGRERALLLTREMRAKGIVTKASLSKDGLKAQLELANRYNVRFTLIIGQKEVLDETVIIREMEGGMQEIVPYGKVIAELQKKLIKKVL